MKSTLEKLEETGFSGMADVSIASKGPIHFDLFDSSRVSAEAPDVMYLSR